MRPIDADALIEEIKIIAKCEDCNSYGGVRCRACSWDDAIGIVDNFGDNHPLDVKEGAS